MLLFSHFQGLCILIAEHPVNIADPYRMGFSLPLAVRTLKLIEECFLLISQDLVCLTPLDGKVEWVTLKTV